MKIWDLEIWESENKNTNIKKIWNFDTRIWKLKISKYENRIMYHEQVNHTDIQVCISGLKSPNITKVTFRHEEMLKIKCSWNLDYIFFFMVKKKRIWFFDSEKNQKNPTQIMTFSKHFRYFFLQFLFSNIFYIFIFSDLKEGRGRRELIART